MIHYASKFLPLFLYPVGIVLLLGLAGLLALRLGRTRLAGGLMIASMAVLWIFSSPLVAHSLLRGLERPYVQPLESPGASAIVLVGGSTVPPRPPRAYVETNAFGDRVLHAGRLYRQGRAPRVVVTGGRIPFLGAYPGTDASMSAALLGEMLGIGGDTLLLAEGKNSREEVIEAGRLFESRGIPRDILLVTSAAHMPRAAAVWRKQGFEVHEAATDFHADAGFNFTLFNLLPREGSLYECWYALHEYYGRAAYRLFGWI
jgi:uncharacterized SAM-binding protein YcdF (DUF218 family)